MTDNHQMAQNLKMFSLIRLKPECKITPVRADFSAPFRYTITYLDPTVQLHLLCHVTTMITTASLPPFFYLLIRYRPSPNIEILPRKPGL